MTKAEVISQLKSLRDSTIDYAKGNNDPVFEKDVEALDATIDFLNQSDREPLPEDDLVPDCVPVIRCKDCSYCRELRRNDPYEDQFAEGCMWCMNISDGVNPDGYCSNAKRRNDNA